MTDDELFNFVEKSNDQINSDLTVTKYNPKHTSDIEQLETATDYNGHLDNVQNDLESLKDLLRNDSYQLDANQLLGVSFITELIDYI
jgi:heat shock transcription factor 1